jgi:hypothetical protein
MSLIGVVLQILVGLLLIPILQALLADEASACLQRFNRAVIRAGVQFLPIRYRARYSEEWLAELDTFAKRPLKGLGYAIETVLSARQTARVLRRPVGQISMDPDQADDATPLISVLRKAGSRPRMRFVDATRYPGFDTFSCRGYGPHVQRVNGSVEVLRHDADKTMSVRVAEDPETGGLLGLYALRRERPSLLRPDMAFLCDAEYIGVIGLSDTLGDTSARLADFLIEDALEQIAVKRRSRIFAVWTIVAGGDLESRRLFQNHGFEILHTSEAYSLLFRPSGRRVSGTAQFDWAQGNVSHVQPAGTELEGDTGNTSGVRP